MALAEVALPALPRFCMGLRQGTIVDMGLQLRPLKYLNLSLDRRRGLSIEGVHGSIGDALLRFPLVVDPSPVSVVGLGKSGSRCSNPKESKC